MSSFFKTSVRSMRSVSSGNYMDGRDQENPGIQVCLTKPRQDNLYYFDWEFTQLSDGTFIIRSISSGLYLDGRDKGIGNGIHVKINKKTFKDASSSKYYKWKVQEFSFEGSTRYAIQSVSSELYLDGRDPHNTGIQLYLTGRNPQGDKYLMWDLSYPKSTKTIRSISSGNYMDGRDQENTGIQVYLTKYPPNRLEYFDWEFTQLPDGTYNIQSISSGLYLDGRYEGIGNGIHVKLVKKPADEESDEESSNKFKWKVQEFSFEGITRYAIQSVSSKLYLDGRDPHNTGIQLYLTDRNPQGDKWLMWDIGDSVGETIDICDPELTDEERNEIWSCLYYTKWNMFPIEQMNEAHDAATEKLYKDLEKIALKETLETVDEKLDIKNFGLAAGIIVQDDPINKVKSAVQYGCQHGFEVQVNAAIRASTAEGVAESSWHYDKNASHKPGRKSSSALAKAASRRGGHAASRAFTALSHPVTGIGAAVGEFAAAAVCKVLGIDDPTVVLVAQACTGILAAAVAGSVVGGPIGAGVGALVGVGTWAITQGVNGLFNAFKGGQRDNWCYIDVKQLRRDDSKKILACTYKNNDVVYMIPYQKKWFSSNSNTDYFSAGNDQDETFQVILKDEWNQKIKKFTRVSYRDMFFVNKHPTKKSLIVVFARGGFNVEKPGFCDFIEHA